MAIPIQQEPDVACAAKKRNVDQKVRVVLFNLLSSGIESNRVGVLLLVTQ